MNKLFSLSLLSLLLLPMILFSANFPKGSYLKGAIEDITNASAYFTGHCVVWSYEEGTWKSNQPDGAGDLGTIPKGDGYWLLTTDGCTITYNNETVNVQNSQTQNNDTTTSFAANSGTHDITNAILGNRSAKCSDYVNTYTSDVKDIQNNKSFKGNLVITVSGDTCSLASNAIPNHDFNDAKAHFATQASEQSVDVKIPTSPTMASAITELTLGTDNAIMLNGVKLDLLAAACHGVGDGKIGCNDISAPWRYDPMSSLNQFGTDSHNAHTQPNGSYHYHGNPKALFDQTGNVASGVIGFAADGFAIYGPYFNDNGTIRKATSSYQLKNGSRTAIDGSNPGGSYDGQYRDDWEYKTGNGDLDECNGMSVDGAYGYYVTDSYPHVLGCFKGTPDSSFNKALGGASAGGNGQRPPPNR